MANRPLAGPHSVITNGDMSGSLTSTPTIIQQLSMMSYSYSWAGATPVGSVSIQFSNDYKIDNAGNVKNAGTWNTATIDVAGTPGTSAPVSGNTGNGLIDIATTGAYAVRTIYTRVSGTGTLNATFVAKVS